MSVNCDNCGKKIQLPKGAEVPEHIFCDECRLAMTKLILKQQAAARREILQLNKRLEEVTDGAIRIGDGNVRDVLVYDGMRFLGKLFGEEIQVIEREDGDSFDWTFQFFHDELSYHTYGRRGDPEDRKIWEEWEAKHETI